MKCPWRLISSHLTVHIKFDNNFYVCFFLHFFFRRLFFINISMTVPHYSWTPVMNLNTIWKVHPHKHTHTHGINKVVDVLRKWCEDISCANNIIRMTLTVSLMSPPGETGGKAYNFSYSPNNTFCRCAVFRLFFLPPFYFRGRCIISEL